MRPIIQLSLVFMLLVLLGANPVYSQEKQVPSDQSQVQLSFAPLVKKAAPAVVNIYTSKKVKVRTSPLMNDPLFNQLFGRNSQLTGTVREKVVNSLGSGVIVSSDGLVMTNNHVIAGSDEIRVVLNDKREFDAAVVLTDKRSDLAVLRINEKGEKFNFLEFGDSDGLEVGDLVLAIGNPFGVGQTVTSGIVSALARNTAGISDYQFFVQTDAAINPGNSGGALVSMDGKLIGINTAIYSKGGGSNGIGFATPANMVRTVLASVTKGGKVVRPWLGASLQEVTPKIAEALGLKSPVGVIVRSVYENGAAAKAGLQINDVILEVGGKALSDQESLRYRIATYDIGTKLPFRVLRKGKEYLAEVEMAPPVETTPRDITLLSGDFILNGVQVGNLSPAMADELGVAEVDGVVITEVRATPAQRIGLQRGDIIVALNKAEIRSVNQLEELLRDAAGLNMTLTLKRAGKLISLRVAL